MASSPMWIRVKSSQKPISRSYSEILFAYYGGFVRAGMHADGLYYWSRLPIKANDVKIENQRPYTRPRLYDEAQSNAVETTSWAVMVYLTHEGVTSIVENAVQWIVSVRMTNNGFVSLIASIRYNSHSTSILNSKIINLGAIIVCRIQPLLTECWPNSRSGLEF